MNLGNLVKAYRAQHKIYQSDLAKQLKITKATLSRIETGQSLPNGHIALQLISILIPDIKQKLESMDASSEIIINQNSEWLNKFNKNKDL